ncbi:MAG: NAD(P)H-dependent oxidoreductase [Phycisphaerales bacterium]|nr:NAD(P)H-dependent oxidoreductase [Phycisphaerales bacterium]
MDLHQQLHWRYATKRMNGQSVSPEKIAKILDAIQLAPSSMGMQPFHVFVISNQELREKIFEGACKQAQVKEGSHLIVFATWKNVTEQHVNDYINNIANTRNVPVESLVGFKNNMLGLISRPQDQNLNWAAKQAYIAFSFGMVAAAMEEVDATPMEGFNPDALDEILGLDAQGLASTCILTLGYRDEANDYLVNAKKVRRSAEDFFTTL